MSVIKVTLPLGEIPVTGKQVSFTAPCDCIATEAIQIDGENYTVCDSVGRCVTGKGGAWSAGEIISVILDVENKKAFALNAVNLSLESGSYIGTGAEGVDGTVSLTFSFAPRVLMLFTETGIMRMGHSGAANECDIPVIGFPQALTTSFAGGLFRNWDNGGIVAKRSEDGNTISWYHNGRTYDEETDEYYPSSSRYGFNGQGVTYNYLAIG